MIVEEWKSTWIGTLKMGTYNMTLKFKFWEPFHMAIEIEQLYLSLESIFTLTPAGNLPIVRENTELYREGILHILKQPIFKERE